MSSFDKIIGYESIKVEIERYYQKVKELLVNNRKFLDELAKEINKKKLLTAKDIQEIKEKSKRYVIIYLVTIYKGENYEIFKYKCRV